MRIMMQLLLVLCMLLALGQPQQLLRRNIIKVRASGFLPFESDLLLPLGILRQLQAQDRASRLLPSPQQQLYRKSKPKQKPPKPKVKQQVRLERAKANAGGAGVQMYNLIDDDGELLLNLRVHNEMSHIDQHLDAAPQSSNHRFEEAELATPWRPSKWRPTARPPLTLTLTSSSSSPRPLPLHQYLSSNSLEQSQQQSLSLSQLQSATTPTTTQQQQRRVFGGRQDWRSYQ